MLCFTIRKINIKCCCCCCCKKKCSSYKVTINDTLENSLCSNKYENLGKLSKYRDIIKKLEEYELREPVTDIEEP